MRMDLPTTGPRRDTGRIQRGGGASTFSKMLQDQSVLARRVPDAECADGLLLDAFARDPRKDRCAAPGCPEILAEELCGGSQNLADASIAFDDLSHPPDGRISAPDMRGFEPCGSRAAVSGALTCKSA